MVMFQLRQNVTLVKQELVRHEDWELNVVLDVTKRPIVERHFRVKNRLETQSMTGNHFQSFWIELL